MTKALLAAVAIALSQSAHAVLIGDKDWMQPFDMPSVSGATFDTIFDSSTGECDVAQCRIENVDMTGYVWASTNEVDELFGSYGFGLSSLTNDSAASFSGGGLIDSFFNDFWFTHSGNGVVNGVVTNIDRIFASTRDQTSSETRNVVYLIDNGHRSLTDFAGLSVFTSNETDLFSIAGSPGSGSIRGWFYKPTESVPEPGTLLLLSSALAGLACLRRPRRV